MLSYLQPGEDVHQAVLCHRVHDALAVVQHGLELRVAAAVGGVEAERTDDVGDGARQLGGQIQGESAGRRLRQDGAQRLGLGTH